MELPYDPIVLGPDELDLRVRSQEGFAVSREGGEVVALDLTLDEGLIRRGLVRDVIRQIQELRKESGLELNDRIELRLEGIDVLTPEDLDVISAEVLAVPSTSDDGDRIGHHLDLEEFPNALAFLAKASASR